MASAEKKDEDDDLEFHPETGLAVPQAALYMVYMTVFMDTIGNSIAAPVLPFYALAFGVSNAAVGYLYSAFSIVSFLGTPILGRWADLYGRRLTFFRSLAIAAIASFGQACAPLFGWNHTGFTVLLIFRAFNGLGAAVTGPANVYVSDVSSPAVIDDCIAKLSQVPTFCRTMGPGLGGGLAHYGLSIPILITGFVTIANLILVYFYVPESPAWLALQEQKKAEQEKAKDQGEKNKAKSDEKVPFVAYTLGASAFFFQVGQAAQGGMLAISAKTKFGWGPLDIGFTNMGLNLLQLAVGLFVAPRLSKWCGKKNTANIGGVFTTIGLLVMSYDRVHLFIIGMGISKVGMGLRQASMGALTARISTAANRGQVFSTLGMFQKAGMAIGPIGGGYTTNIDPKHLLWYFCAFNAAICTISLFFIKVDEGGADQTASKTTKLDQPLLTGYDDLVEGPLEDEVGEAKDYEDLGQYVGGLLTTRHYRWVSHKTEVYGLISRALPVLSTDASQHKDDLERYLQLTQMYSSTT